MRKLGILLLSFFVVFSMCMPAFALDSLSGEISTAQTETTLDSALYESEYDGADVNQPITAPEIMPSDSSANEGEESTGWFCMLNEETGLLTITGGGPVFSSEANWLNKSDVIKMVLFKDSFSFIEAGLFYNCENLEKIVFLKDAPEFDNNCLDGLDLEVVYPSDNGTWTEDLLQDYGGKIEWTPMGEEQIDEMLSEKNADVSDSIDEVPNAEEEETEEGVVETDEEPTEEITEAVDADEEEADSSVLSWEQWYEAAIKDIDLDKLSEKEFKMLYVSLVKDFEEYRNTFSNEGPKVKAIKEESSSKSALTSGTRGSTPTYIGEGTFANEYLEVAISSIGQFTIGTIEGDPNYPSDNNEIMLYGHPSPGTSKTLLLIGNNEYTFTADDEDSVIRTDSQAVATMHITEDGHDVEIVETLTFGKSGKTNFDDLVDISYSVKNKGSKAENVGVRIMLDTMLSSNDNAPFKVPNYGSVTTVKTFTGADIPSYYQVYDDLTSPSILATGYLKSGTRIPDKVQFTSWPTITDASWDYEAPDGDDLGDSAVGIYFDPVKVGSGRSTKVSTQYGVGVGLHINSGMNVIDSQHVQLNVINGVSKAPVEGALVKTSDGTEISTDSNGLVTLELDKVNNLPVTISKADYNSETLKREMTGGRQYTVLLTKKGESTPVIKEVNFTTISGKIVNVMTDSLKFCEDKSKLLDSTKNKSKIKTVKMQVKTDIADCTFYLYKDGTQIAKNSNGIFEFKTMEQGKGRYDLISTLSAGRKYSVKCVSNKGKTDSTEVLLKVYSPTLSAHSSLIDDLKNEKLNFFPTGTADIPDNFFVKFIAGSSHKFKLSGDKLNYTPEVSFDTESKKLKIGIGVSRDFIDNQKATNEYCNYVDRVYRNNTPENEKKLKEAVNRWKESGKSKYKLGKVSTSIDVTGYGEFLPDETGKWTGTLYLTIFGNGSASITTRYPTIPFTVVPIPCYITFGGEGKIGFEFSGGVRFGSAKEFIKNLLDTLSAKFNFYIGGFVEGGAGDPLVAKVGVNVKLGLNFDYWFNTSYLELSLKTKGSIVWKALLYTGSHDVAEAQWTIIKKYMKNRSSVNTAEAPPLSIKDIVDADNTKLLPRNYKADSTSFSDDDVTLDQDKAFADAEPTVVMVGDDEYCFWLNDMADREAQNRTSLVYSVNGDEEVELEDDGTADFSYSVSVEGNDIYVAWMDSSSVLDENANLTEAWKNMDISLAKINTANGNVNIYKVTDNNGIADLMPAVFAAGGKAYVAWNSMTSGPFEDATDNKLNYCVFNNTALGPVTSIDIGSQPIGNIQIQLKDNVPTAVYTTVSWDDVLEEDTQTTKYVSMTDGSVSESDIDSSGTLPVSSKLGDEETIYWYKDGNIYYAPFGSGSGEANVVFSEDNLPETLSGEFIVVPSQGKTYLIWLYGLLSEDEETVYRYAYASVYENGNWGPAHQIADLGDGTISSLVGMVDENGELVLSWQRSFYNEDGTLDYTELCKETVCEYKDIQLVDINYDEAGAGENEVFSFDAVLKNNGSVNIDSAEVYIDDSYVTTISGLNLKPGETTTKVIDYTIPYSGEYLYNVNIFSENDCNPNNGNGSFIIGHSMLRIGTVDAVSYEGRSAERLEIINDAGFDTKDIIVRIYGDNEQGSLLYESFVGTVSKKSSTYISVPSEIFEGVDNAYVYIIAGNEETESDILPTVISCNTDSLVFLEEYNFSINIPENGSVGTYEQKYEEGQNVELKAVPDEGYEFWQWISDTECEFENPYMAETSFTMPSNDVVLTAEFRQTVPAENFTVIVPEQTGNGDEVFVEGNTIEMEPDDSLDLSSSVEPSNSSDHVEWSSSDENVATVDIDGYVTTVGPGEAEITAKCGGCEVQTIQVTVVPVAIEGLEIQDINEEKTVFINGIGVQEITSLNIEPFNATENVVWSSSDETIVTVDQNGTVTSVSCGEAVITVEAETSTDENGEAIKDSFTVVVGAEIESMSFSEASLAVNKGSTATIDLAFEPAGASQISNVEWGYDPEIIDLEVSDNGEITVIGLETGSTGLVATVTEGDQQFTAICNVKVGIFANKVSFESDHISVKLGRYIYNEMYIEPEDATDSISYYSSNSNVVEVQEDGLRAVGEGTATVTATTEHGVSGQFEVTVLSNIVYATQISELQSTHNYENGISDTWYYTVEDACSLAVQFSEDTYTEIGYDYITISDKYDNEIGWYSGGELSGKTVNVPGNTVKITLDTDSSATEYGFKVTSVSKIHMWDSGKITQKATFSADGVKTYTCSHCGTTKTSAINKVSKPSLSTTTYTYNGKAKKPTVTVKNSSGVSLIKDTDYTVTYSSGRKAVGRYKVTVTLKGKYEGTKGLYFQINPAKPKISGLSSGKKSLKVTAAKKASGYGASRFKIAYKIKGGSWKYTYSTSKSKTISSLKSKKYYYVKIRAEKKVNGKWYYSTWTTAKSIKVK